jgi:molybdopterin-guanine dinucleotide biosynthesis protein A
MGRDKALVEVDGVAMAERVVDALRAGGATRVVRIGGATGDIPDAFPGEGPLGGIITALRWASGDVVVTAPCDMPWLDAEHAQALVAQRTGDVAYAKGAHLFAAWAPSALPVLEAAFAAGERSPKRALARLVATEVDLGDGRSLADVDSPADLT